MSLSAVLQSLISLCKLTDASIFSKPIERQKVSICLEVFCDRTISALKLHPLLTHQDVNDTAKFIVTFAQFWKTLNVDGSLENIRLNDKRRSVILSAFDQNLQFLRNLCDLAISMSPAIISVRVKSLSPDASSNLFRACYELIDLATFLLENNHDYIVLGNF